MFDVNFLVLPIFCCTQPPMLGAFASYDFAPTCTLSCSLTLLRPWCVQGPPCMATLTSSSSFTKTMHACSLGKHRCYAKPLKSSEYGNQSEAFGPEGILLKRVGLNSATYSIERGRWGGGRASFPSSSPSDRWYDWQEKQHECFYNLMTLWHLNVAPGPSHPATAEMRHASSAYCF
jgi:hypothetical protein